MAKQAYLGNKIRQLRKDAELTQVELSRRLEISASYLNLIERNQRALTVPLLLKLAELFQLDLKTFAEDDESQLVADLKEAFSDPVFAERAIRDEDIRELMAGSQELGRAILDLYRSYRKSHEDAQTMAARLSEEEVTYGLETSRQPAEEVSDVLQERTNWFPTLERAAQDLWREATLAPGEVYRGLIRHLEHEHRVKVEVATTEDLAGAVRRYSADSRLVVLSEALPTASAAFQIAHQIALIGHLDALDEIIANAKLSSDEARRLCRVALANYFAGAVLMPYGRFLEESRALRYDVELLQHRFRTSFEQVCHRLTTLNDPQNSGIPFHLVRVDIAGNISKRYSGSGMPFARYSGACPLWNVHAAFMTPGFIQTQLSEMTNGARYFSIARTVRKAGGGHEIRQNRFALELGCQDKYARDLVYADGVDLQNRKAVIPIGVSCRLCERMECRQRAFPPMHHRLGVDENVRGLSFYYSPPTSG